MTTRPLIDSVSKQRVVRKVRDAVLSKWVDDPNKVDKRTLSLIYLAHYSDVLENAFAPLSDDNYDLAMKRVRDLEDLEPEEQAQKPNANEIMWCVISALIKSLKVC